MVNSWVEIYSYPHIKCSTGLILRFFLNKIIKSDFVLLKSENGINFLLMAAEFPCPARQLQLTTFIIKL